MRSDISARLGAIAALPLLTLAVASCQAPGTRAQSTRPVSGTARVSRATIPATITWAIGRTASGTDTAWSRVRPATNTTANIRAAALALAKQEGLPVDKVVDEIEVMFDVDGNPKTDPNVPGYSLSERTIRRWLNEEGWTPVDVSSYPMGAWPHPDADISKIKDAVTHFSINAAMDSVGVRDYDDRDIDDTIADVLEDVILRVRPRNQGTIDFLVMEP